MSTLNQQRHTDSAITEAYDIEVMKSRGRGAAQLEHAQSMRTLHATQDRTMSLFIHKEEGVQAIYTHNRDMFRDASSACHFRTESERTGIDAHFTIFYKQKTMSSLTIRTKVKSYANE